MQVVVEIWGDGGHAGPRSEGSAFRVPLLGMRRFQVQVDHFAAEDSIGRKRLFFLESAAPTSAESAAAESTPAAEPSPAESRTTSATGLGDHDGPGLGSQSGEIVYKEAGSEGVGVLPHVPLWGIGIDVLESLGPLLLNTQRHGEG